MHLLSLQNLPRAVKGKKAQKKEKHDFRENHVIPCLEKFKVSWKVGLENLENLYLREK